MLVATTCALAPPSCPTNANTPRSVSGNAPRPSQAITVERVLTDNGSCYKSKLFTRTSPAISHKRIRTYRPQTDDKVERCNCNCAYLRLYTTNTERTAALADFLQIN